VAKDDSPWKYHIAVMDKYKIIKYGKNKGKKYDKGPRFDSLNPEFQKKKKSCSQWIADDPDEENIDHTNRNCAHHSYSHPLIHWHPFHLKELLRSTKKVDDPHCH
jgi:hypothetical protein